MGVAPLLLPNNDSDKENEAMDRTDERGNEKDRAVERDVKWAQEPARGAQDGPSAEERRRDAW